MRNKAPDTRNKLDDNKGIKKHPKKKKSNKKTFGDIIKKDSTSVNSNSQKLTKGEIFKKANGFSKSTKRSLTKNGLNPFMMDILKAIRKERKIKEKKIRQEKRKVSQAYKRLNKKTSTNKKKN